VAFEIAQAASFLMSNSACCRRFTRGRIILASITACFNRNTTKMHALSNKKHLSQRKESCIICIYPTKKKKKKKKPLAPPSPTGRYILKLYTSTKSSSFIISLVIEIIKT
jgi:hypothetical protein